MDYKFVEWDNKYNTNIDIIDEQHKVLVEFTNKLFEGFKQNKEESNKTFGAVVKETVNYVKEHFSTEEKLMIKYNYSDYAHHKKQHEAFILEVLKEVKNFETGSTFAPNRFVRFLRDWLFEHIAVVDNELGLFLSKKIK